MPEPLRSLFHRPDLRCVEIIDQTLLPHRLQWVELRELPEFCHAIEAMQVRGAPLIGITAAFALAFALEDEASDAHCRAVAGRLLATRPTAVNLRWALERISRAIEAVPLAARASLALKEADRMVEEDVAVCRDIGQHGLAVLRRLSRDHAADASNTVNILTHCNAGWLATLEWGTALAPVYAAHREGLPVHVWVSETRPRNQGASLTCWELSRAGIPHTLIVDNAAGHLLQAGRVDCVIVGSDRTAANGDVCNKIGTYLKALAAREARVPFYVALPASTIDWTCEGGDAIPIEERGQEEVLTVHGRDASGKGTAVQLTPEGVAACNPAFDVTPAALVSELITEYGRFAASPEGMRDLQRRLG